MIYRIEIVPRGDVDPVGAGTLNEIRTLGIASVSAVTAGRVFLLEGDDRKLSADDVRRVAAELLADPVVETFGVGDTQLADRGVLVEVHYKPGVMDPVALSTAAAIADMGVAADSVRTARIYRLAGKPSDAEVQTIMARVLANDCIEQAVVGSLGAAPPPHAPEHAFRKVTVPIRDLDDAGLKKLSERGHLFLNVTEMRGIQDYFRRVGREPSDIELETLAQTWSEHCVHKTLKSRVECDFGFSISDSGLEEKDAKGEAGAIQSTIENLKSKIPPTVRRVYENLLADTIAAATKKLNKPWCISVFKDNAGVIEFDDKHAVCFKVETHNHPSAIEPYGGAATGIGGCIRDPMGTGLGAKPVANTDIFCFAPPDWPVARLPKGVLHPRRVMRGVVSGVRDYGNRMGIPTVNGALFFDPRYLGNPLVFCGNVGLMDRDKCFKNAASGDAIVVVGGRTGRDGIHGATFSSGEMTHTHEDEFSHAVQIGNAITEKKMTDVLQEARRRGLYSAITDCGAGGLSSAVGEMGETLGAQVNLETVPLKYAGLSYTEIWISEAQERMVLAVPQKDVAALLALFASEDVEATVIGTFADDRILRLSYKGEPVGELEMEFLHDGLPKYTRKAEWRPAPPSALRTPHSALSHTDALKRLLGHWNIASKEWVVRQYDHEVQGGSVIKPLVGAVNDGPGDGAVFQPVLGSPRGVALACGMSPRLGDIDPYQMALHAIDECVRNLVCVGADIDRIAILDNFCWGNCAKPDRLGSLVLAAQACYDGALAYGTPFISGKDSLNNEFVAADGSVITIPPTLLISGIAIVADVTRCASMDAKADDNVLLLVGATQDSLTGSHYELVTSDRDPHALQAPPLAAGAPPVVDLKQGPRIARAVAGAIAAGGVRAAHDCSEGGLAVAIAEMCLAGGLGFAGELDAVNADAAAALFGESPSRYLLEVEPAKLDALRKSLGDVPSAVLGKFAAKPTLTLTHRGAKVIEADVAALKQAWQQPLAW
ncbi:MAG: Phosphoribosylformylglycinamidine synthase subunit PurL [Phycisphaerae bacterium]|nr:Phosphoribosylformylglycinamidine synthase subunit PurL [Phycisphaerae bacterium]